MGFFKNFLNSNDDNEDVIESGDFETNNVKDSRINFYDKESKGIKVQTNIKYVTIKPKTLKEGNKVMELIKKGYIVTFVLESLNMDEQQRLVDIVSGAINMVDAKILTVAKNVYTVTPSGVTSEEVFANDEEK